MWICSSDSVSIQRDILNFLREGELPHRDRVRAVHREAQYYAIGPLLDSLEDTQPLTGEKVRQAFLDLLPYYKGKCSPPPSHDVMNKVLKNIKIAIHIDSKYLRTNALSNAHTIFKS